MATITPEQRQEIEKAGEQPVVLTDPNTNSAYYLIRAELYHEIREVLEEERQRAAIAKKARKNAASRIDE
jgi:PHD/YefM family antitoxin component YafN of YafNO toxin-antitoxin module